MQNDWPNSSNLPAMPKRARVTEVIPEPDQDTSRMAFEIAYPLVIRGEPVIILGGMLSRYESYMQMLAMEMGVTPPNLQSIGKKYANYPLEEKVIREVWNYPLRIIDRTPITIKSIRDYIIEYDGEYPTRTIIVDLNICLEQRDQVEEMFLANCSKELIAALAKETKNHGFRILIIRPGCIDPDLGPKATRYEPLDMFPRHDETYPDMGAVKSLPETKEVERRTFYRNLLKSATETTGNAYLNLADASGFWPFNAHFTQELLTWEFKLWRKARFPEFESDDECDGTEITASDEEEVGEIYFLDVSGLGEVEPFGVE